MPDTAARRTSRLIVFLCFLLCPTLAVPSAGVAQNTTAARGESSTITAAVPRNWPPYYMTDDNGHTTGFAIDIFNAIAARAGYHVSYKVFPTIAQANEAGVKGTVDVQPNFGDIPSRRSLFKFTPPVQTFDVTIFVRRETHDIRGVGDLDGRRVAVVTSNVGLRLMKQRPAVRRVEFQGIWQALFALLSGSVDALIYPEPVVLDLARQARVEDRIRTAGPPLLEIKRAIAVNPARVEIHRLLSAAVRQFVGTPEYARIYAKWFGRPEPYWSVGRVLWWTGGLFVLITIGFFAFHYLAVMRLNRALERRVDERTAELQAAQEGLLRAERLSTLGEITGTVAHELRNPLGTIMTSFEVVRNRTAGAGVDIADTLDRIQRNIDRCTVIIADLLNYARPDRLRKEPTDLAELLTQIIGEYDFPAAVAVKTDLGAAQRGVEVDREQFRRVVVNLLDNACQAITQDDRRGETDRSGRIRIEAAIPPADPSRLEISVIDTGPGINPDDREKIFEPLFSTKSFGVGLGLPNVQKIVASHGGHLTVESEPGRGTAVTISLPLAAEEKEARRA